MSARCCRRHEAVLSRLIVAVGICADRSLELER